MLVFWIIYRYSNLNMYIYVNKNSINRECIKHTGHLWTPCRIIFHFMETVITINPLCQHGYLFSTCFDKLPLVLIVCTKHGLVATVVSVQIRNDWSSKTDLWTSVFFILFFFSSFECMVRFWNLIYISTIYRVLDL